MLQFLKENMLGYKEVSKVANSVATMMKGEDNVIAEIHNEFDTAAQKAVEQAKKILENSSKGEAKKQAETLIAAGFINVPQVIQWNQERDKYGAAQRTIQLVEKYAARYPGYKFILIDQVKEICNKYGLICAPVGKYKGTVPQKNITEIGAFKPHKEDTYYEERNFLHRGVEFDFSKPNNFINAIGVERQRDAYRQDMVMGYIEALSASRFANQKSFSSVPLFICAPKGDIIMNNDDKVSNGVFMTREIKDPIVLHFVKDGFLVVTKWGLESKDPSLVNEKMN